MGFLAVASSGEGPGSLQHLLEWGPQGRKWTSLLQPSLHEHHSQAAGRRPMLLYGLLGMLLGEIIRGELVCILRHQWEFSSGQIQLQNCLVSLSKLVHSRLTW